MKSFAEDMEAVLAYPGPACEYKSGGRMVEIKKTMQLPKGDANHRA